MVIKGKYWLIKYRIYYCSSSIIGPISYNGEQYWNVSKINSSRCYNNIIIYKNYIIFKMCENVFFLILPIRFCFFLELNILVDWSSELVISLISRIFMDQIKNKVRAKGLIFHVLGIFHFFRNFFGIFLFHLVFMVSKQHERGLMVSLL